MKTILKNSIAIFFLLAAFSFFLFLTFVMKLGLNSSNYLINTLVQIGGILLLINMVSLRLVLKGLKSPDYEWIGFSAQILNRNELLWKRLLAIVLSVWLVRAIVVSYRVYKALEFPFAFTTFFLLFSCGAFIYVSSFYWLFGISRIPKVIVNYYR